MTNDIIADLKDTLKMIKVDNYNDRYSWMKNSTVYGHISQCYAFSNENLNWYYPLFNVKDNDVLTVCGSGDQVLTAILCGAKSVDVFDSNKLAYYHLILKMSAIKSLDFKDFIKFYTLKSFSDERKGYCEVITQNILDEGVKLFWNQIFLDEGNLSHCFLGNNSYPEFIMNEIPYLNEKNYYILKSKLNEDKINFKNVDIFKTADAFNKKYAFINLSNILYYILDKQAYIYFINLLSNKNLKENGSILLNYYWDDTFSDSKNEIVYQTLNAKSYKSDYKDNDGLTKKTRQEIKVYTKQYLA